MISYRAALQMRAAEYASRGWPVAAMRNDGGDAADHPFANWVPVFSDPSTDPRVVTSWWRSETYGIGLVTGEQFAFLDVPAGRVAQTHAVSGRHVPVIAGVKDRWLFMVGVHDALNNRREALCKADVRVHCEGVIVLAPPTRTTAGSLYWHLHPGESAWVPADSAAVIDALLDESASDGSS
ncbi:bifunctional DNA primase/polymerase [Fodinicola acaciae]|uniref:bifunctional DNA primase/polymerase n=1 Tax=Fodinicola acaciae TaxID=2681555 RepID=UPI0013D6AB06|nr:bifunctional DNA primase/polymerase [Fodinicola acaciae]